MIFNIVAGHSVKAQGASKYINEVTENRKVKNELINILRNSGQTVYDCTSDMPTADSVLSNASSKCRQHNGLDVHIHFNSGMGKGCEVWTYGNSSTANNYANSVCKELEKLGFRNRGVKTASFYVFRHSSNPSILIEVCFTDTKSDCVLYNSLGEHKIATAIAKGLGVTTTASKPTTSSTSYYPKYTGRSLSIADALSKVGEPDVSYKHRSEIAKANGITDFKGTYAQNVYMLKLLKNGTLKRVK